MIEYTFTIVAILALGIAANEARRYYRIAMYR